MERLDPASLGALAWACGVCNVPARRLFRDLAGEKAHVVADPWALARTLWACAVLDLRAPATSLFDQYTTLLAQETHTGSKSAIGAVFAVHDGIDEDDDYDDDGINDNAYIVADVAWAAARLQARGMNLPHLSALTDRLSEWVSRQKVDGSGVVSAELACVVSALVCCQPIMREDFLREIN